MQLDWHDLRTNGCPTLLRALKLIETVLTEQEQDITELQYLISEEIMAGLTTPAELREVVEKRGHGWRTICQPSDTPAATTTVGVPGDTWLPGPDWVTDYAAATDAQ
jgi:hypothetical protein